MKERKRRREAGPFLGSTTAAASEPRAAIGDIPVFAVGSSASALQLDIEIENAAVPLGMLGAILTGRRTRRIQAAR